SSRRRQTRCYRDCNSDVCSSDLAPSYLDNQMHDLHVERFLKDEAGDGPIKSFTLRGIKDSPPYLHDGRCLTLEDTVEFFNLVLRSEESRVGRVWSGRCLRVTRIK